MGARMALRQSTELPRPVRDLSVLDSISFGVLVLVADRVVRPLDDAQELAHRIDQSLQFAAPEVQREFEFVLRVLENSLSGWLLRGSAKLFSELSIEDREAALDRWGQSPIELLRGAMEALRKLCLGNHYAVLEAAKEIGYPGPSIPLKPTVPIGARKALSTEPVRGLIEAQTLQQDLSLDVDVCIIGSGAGGAVAAAQLAKANYKVVILEEGGYFSTDRYTMKESECYPQLYQEALQRSTKDLSVTVLQGKSVGGGTEVNWTTCFRTPEATLDIWRRHHQVSGLESSVLAPHFAEVEKRLSISPIPIEKLNRNNQLLWDGCKSLGIGVELLHRNVIGCAYTGYCGMGCPVGLKQSMRVTYIQDALNHHASLVSRCRVHRLDIRHGEVHGAEGQALDAHGLSETGPTIRVRAKKFIVSGGAIGSPALLLRSGATDPHRRLGQRTFLHPTIVSSGDYAEPVNAYHGAPQGVASHHFAERGDQVGYFLEAAPIYPALLATASPQYGQAHRALMKRIPHLAGHIALAIDGHHPDDQGGQVRLRSSGRPVLDYTPSQAVFEGLRAAQKTLASVQLATGAERVMTLHSDPVTIRSSKDIKQLDEVSFSPLNIQVFSAHQMGGCMMSDEPRLGVVRAQDLRHHQINNLYVMDGSVFPTSCGVNPQLSIYGLVHLITTRLIDAGLG